MNQLTITALDCGVMDAGTADDRNCKRATAEKVRGIGAGRCRVTVSPWVTV